jgi:uncharacterized protein YndB with AHSA1/START domain
VDAASNLADRTIVTTRIIAAPRELVLDAFTDPEHLARWWGPEGFSLTTHSFEMRCGGIWDFTMHGPDGRDYENRIIFDEIVRPESLVMRHSGVADGRPVSFIHTITLEDLGGRTRLTMRGIFPTAAERDRVVREHHADEGGRQTLGRLAQYLDEELFTFSRHFKVPRELVWKVWTDAQHLARWWGPKGFTWIEGNLDLRPGGMFHYGMSSPEGKEMWGRFVFHEIVPPERLAFVNSFSDKRGAIVRAPFSDNWPLEVFNLLTLEEEDGGTRLILRGAPINAGRNEHERFQSMKPSMNQGWSGTMEQLEKYLEELA